MTLWSILTLGAGDVLPNPLVTPNAVEVAVVEGALLASIPLSSVDPSVANVIPESELPELVSK